MHLFRCSFFVRANMSNEKQYANHGDMSLWMDKLTILLESVSVNFPSLH